MGSCLWAVAELAASSIAVFGILPSKLRKY